MKDYGCLKQILFAVLGLILVTAVGIVIGSIGSFGFDSILHLIFRRPVFEKVFKNLFYIFGSWALVHFIYQLAIDSTEKISEKGKLETSIYVIKQLAFVFGAVALGAAFTGLAWFYIERLATLDGFIQAAIVIAVPALFGIFKGLKKNKQKLDQQAYNNDSDLTMG